MNMHCIFLSGLSVWAWTTVAHASSSIESSLDSWSGRPSHLAVVNPAVPTEDGSVLSLRGEWEFSDFRHALEARDLRYHLDRDFWGKDSAGWKNLRRIQVPGCWEAQGVGKAGNSVGYDAKPNGDGCVRLRHVHIGNGFYRKRVTIPASWAGKRIWLKVGRAQTWAWAWIDDKPVAHFCEAHRALKWDVTDLVTPGKSCIVKFQVDNAYTGWRNTQAVSVHRWGGLTRDVELEATPATFIDDAWVRGDFDRRVAQVHVSIAGMGDGSGRGKGGCALKVSVEGGTKEIPLTPASALKAHIVEIPLGTFRPWSPEHPNLYTAKVELVSADGTVLQKRLERFGVRKLEVRGKEFYLNDRPFFFRGFGDDSTYPITGISPPSKAYHLKHLKKARAAGFNFVRTHTHCEIPEYFEAADEAGVFVQPELSYNCDISSCETFAFDPVGDAKAIWQGSRRHPSFAVYSGGNEGTLGPAGKALFDWVHANDPDRLVIEQDGGTYFEGHRTDTSDYASGPMSMWERGSFNKRAFICHEYANLAIKGDARMEGDYTGVWMPRMTRTMRRTNLAPAGLGDAWGDRLQDAQHDFQRMWAIRSVEHARKDPFCDGYIFWTIVDYTHFDVKMNAPNCQGLWDPFWRAKPHGTTAEDMTVVNSETAILLDTENRVRTYREDDDPMLCCGSLRKLVIDETNRVYSVGETIPAEFILAHYGENDLVDAKLSWSLALTNGTTLASGEESIGCCAAGPAKRIAKASIVIPPISRPSKATLAATVAWKGGKAEMREDFWLFPKCPRRTLPPSVVVADLGSSEADAARRSGKSLLLVGNRKGERDIFPGWWSTDWRDAKWTQNGVAAVPHEMFGDFPYEPYLSPLLFRMMGQGTPLPVAGFSEKDFVMVGEGNTDFKLYLAAKTRPDGGREVFVSGLDIFSESVESRSLFNAIVGFLDHPPTKASEGLSASPKGTEWESEQELGLNKLPPRAWFGHFPDTESAKGILMQTSPWHRFLDSETEWRFAWTKSPKERPVDFYKTDYDVSGWDVVKVPCSWQAAGIRKSLERFGMPLFLNQPYLWAGSLSVPAPEGLWPKVTGAKVPADWWLGPQDNPVGSYRRDFEVPADWADKDVYLQFDGVESFFYLWVNGTYVGYSKNSRNAAAFDVTKYVKPGKNMVAVEVYRNSDGSYLEAQDVYRLSGIHRHVRLYCAPKRSIADAKIVTKPSVPGCFDGDWNVKVDAEFRYSGHVRDFGKDIKPGCTISARVFDAQNRAVKVGGVTSGSTLHTDNTPYWADNNFSIVKLDLKVAQPLLWSAEEPNLYTLVLELRDWEGKFLEAVGFQLGFRAVAISEAKNPMDRTFLFNGKPIKLKGVNRGECHPKYGHYVPDEVVLQDIKLIKQANMNHIRCSHFPQGEYFYYLCNKFGIYLMDEANVESHGYAYGDLSPSHREEWVAAHWDRVRAMYEWEKNNPSVILWSLGNEAGPGRVFKECYENLKGRDPDGRPINWERNNSLVDIGSRQYPPVSWVRDVAAGTNIVKYPYHINEYAHDRLSCPNDLKAYQDAIESSDRIMGAAIWDWADQALLKKVGGGEEGRWIDAFGGDWGEKPVEAAGGDGILEGVVKADRTPEPSYWEAKYAFQPYCWKRLEDGRVEIESKNFFTDSAAVRFEYRMMSDGRFTGEWKPLEIGCALGPREKRILALPTEARAVRDKPGTAIRFRAVQLAEKNLIPAGWTVAEDQIERSADGGCFDEGTQPPTSNLQPLTSHDVLSIGRWKFSKKDGMLTDFGMKLDAFRFPVGVERASYVGPGPNAIYRECLREGLRNLNPTLERFTTPVRDGADWTFETVQVWRGRLREDGGSVSHTHAKIVELGPTTATNTGFRTVNRWRVCADGSLDVDTSFERLGRVLDGKPKSSWGMAALWQIVPRLGWRFELPVTGAVAYYGTGPWETYPHRKAGAFPAVWRAPSVRDMGFAYTRNQDFGNRVDVRWVSIEEAGFKVMTRGVPFGMAVSPWSPTELITHDHPQDLPTPTRTRLTISAVPSSEPVLKLKLRRNP